MGEGGEQLVVSWLYIELSFGHACIYVFLISNFSGVWLPSFRMFKRQEQSEDLFSLSFSFFLSFFLSFFVSLYLYRVNMKR